RYAIETLPPLLMAASRWIVPGIAFISWARIRGSAPAPTAEHWKTTAIVGVFLLVGGNGIVSWAEQWVPSGWAALLIATVPLWMALLQWAIARQRGRSHSLAPLAAFGIALGFAGVAILLAASGKMSGISNEGFDSRSITGSFMLILAALLWAIGSLYSREASLPSSPILATGMQMLCGGIALLILGSLTGEWSRVELSQVSARSFLALLYLMSFGSVLGFTAYVWLLRVSSPEKVATYAYVNPVVAVFLGWIAGGEPVTSGVLAASAVIVGSVVLITSARKT
ncbi:MAG TPA: EamA family transporter, partial [bacterium]|nr:EamA family transporter [bacterium]